MGETNKTLFEELLFDSPDCVLATASLDGKPEAATVNYCADDNYNVYFNTFLGYRKYQNLQSNPQASIVISQNFSTIQMDGVVVQLEGPELEQAREDLLKKNPQNTVYLSDPKGLFFRFEPYWIRSLTDDGDTPPKEEIIRDEK